MSIARIQPLLMAAWLAALTAALLLTVAVALGETPWPGELRTVREIQTWAFPGQALSDAIRALTTTTLVVLLGTLLSVGLYVSGHRREALVLLALMFVLPFMQAGLKNLIDRPRPTAELVDIRAEFTSESYPAGHVMSPTVLYGYVIWLCWVHRRSWPRVISMASVPVCAAIIALTGLVNLWLGVHWPADVLGGYAWGLVLLLPALLAEAALTPA